MFFSATKAKLSQALTKLQRYHCCYMGEDGQGTSQCDCKYGYEPDKPISEHTGCPELRCAALTICF